jgi:hypothetical protein
MNHTYLIADHGDNFDSNMTVRSNEEALVLLDALSNVMMNSLRLIPHSIKHRLRASSMASFVCGYFTSLKDIIFFFKMNSASV